VPPLPDLAIRRCRPGESEAVLALWRRAQSTPSLTDTAADVGRLLGEPTAVLLVAVENDTIIGTVIGGWDGWRGNVYRLAVDPDHQRRGVARSLVAAVDRELEAMGARRTSALVDREHPWAVGFWDSLAGVGYQLDPRNVRYVKTIS